MSWSTLLIKLGNIDTDLSRNCGHQLAQKRTSTASTPEMPRDRAGFTPMATSYCATHTLRVGVFRWSISTENGHARQTSLVWHTSSTQVRTYGITMIIEWLILINVTHSQWSCTTVEHTTVVFTAYCWLPAWSRQHPAPTPKPMAAIRDFSQLLGPRM